jgi:hypothetical protein
LAFGVDGGENLAREGAGDGVPGRTSRELAEWYGVPLRTIQNWRTVGKRAGERPPLDDPEAMGTWWATHCKYRIPPAIERKRIELERVRLGRAVAAVEVPSVPADVAPLLDLSDDDALKGALDRARRMERLAIENYNKACDEGRTAEAGRYHREWIAASARVREWERDIGKMRLSAGELMETKGVVGEVMQVLTTVSAQVLNVLMAMAAELAPARPESERRALAVQLRDRAFEHVRETRYGTRA